MDGNQHQESRAEAAGDAVGSGDRRTAWFICIFLAAITLAVFGRTVLFGFVNYDDNVFVYDSPAVMNGLTADGVARAFSHGSFANWDPMTTLSHMLDCQIYGLNAGGHHLTNVLLHTASVILLFLVLRKLTGAVWPSAFAAALFAIHPLRAESVAWVTERKDVLSGLFFMLTLGAYAKYADASKVQRSLRTATKSKVWYVAVLVLFALGLMSKVMLVTLPLVLLVLDYWPLRRNSKFKIQNSKSDAGCDGVPWGKLVLEKIPFLVLSLGAGVVAVVVQKRDNAVQSLEAYPLPLRAANAVVSVATYIRQMFWPGRLAVLYPFPVHGLPAGVVVASTLLVAAISAAALWYRRRQPYFLAGWLWFLIMLLPVTGLLQVGKQAHADRYTYLPQIGLYIALAWMASGWAAGRSHRVPLLGVLAAVALAALGICAFRQVSCWRDSESLWRQALASAPETAMAHNGLGLAMLGKGGRQEAIEEFHKAMRVDPDDFGAHNNLGMALAGAGRTDEAMAEFRKAIQLLPDHAEVHNNLGSALADSGRTNEALAEFQLAVRLQPDYALAHKNLSRLLAEAGRTQEAIAESETALKLQPGLVDTRFQLANLLVEAGRLPEAMAQYQAVVNAEPQFVDARYDLGALAYRRGQVDDAIAQFQAALAARPDFAPARRALELIAWDLATSPRDESRDGRKALALAQQLTNHPGAPDPTELATVAAAYAEMGQYAQAAATAGQARELATAQTNASLAAALQEQAEAYQSGRPFRDTGSTNAQSSH